MVHWNQPIGSERSDAHTTHTHAALHVGLVCSSLSLNSSLRPICAHRTQQRCTDRFFLQMAHHTHAHSHGDGKSLIHASKTCRLGTVLLLTIGYFFVELICGYMLHSVAIVADAIHMLSDSGALIIAMVSVRVSSVGLVRGQGYGVVRSCRLRNVNRRRTRSGMYARAARLTPDARFRLASLQLGASARAGCYGELYIAYVTVFHYPCSSCQALDQSRVG